MASKKIKGITIKFGADTSALGKALKETEDTSKKLGSELTKVNKLLKFDPSNTVLVAQKQKLLSEQVENSKKKLEGLKAAQSEVERQFKAGKLGVEEYREFQREIEKTKQDINSYETQLKKLVSEQSKLKESTKQLNAFFEATEKNLDDFQDILGSRLVNALKHGSANADDLTIAINKIGKATYGAKTDISGLKAALNKIDSGGIDEVRRSLKKLEDSSNDAEDALNQIGDGISAGNLMEAGEQLSGLGDKALDMAEKAVQAYQEIENAKKKVNARFAETGSEALIKSIYESGLGDSLESVANSVVLVRDNIKGLDEVDLKNITSQALVLEDVYGIDMPETLRGVNGLMVNFGLSAQDAMDLIIAGTQNGLDKTNELGDNLSEYSGKFAQAGYSAEEYFQLLQNGLDGGAYNLDKVNDAINEVTTRLTDGTIQDSFWVLNEETGQLEEGTGKWNQSVKDVFAQWQDGEATQKQVIDAIIQDIQSTENQQDKLNKAALAFGTMGEDGGAKFIESLSAVGNSYNDVSGKAKKLEEDTDTSAREMEASMRKLQDAFAPIGEDIQEMLTPVLDFIGEISELVSEIPEPVRNFIEIFGGIAILASIILPIITNIIGLNMALVSLVGVGLLPIVGVIAAVAAAIAGIIAVIKNWGAITEWLSEKWTEFKDWLSKLWESISKNISETWDRIIESLKEVWDRIYNVIEVPLELIIGLIDGAMYAIYAIIYTIWEVIRLTLQNTWNWIKDTASEIFTPIANFFSETWNGIKGTAIEIWKGIKDSLSGIWEGMKNSGEEAFSTFWNFIKEGFTSLKDALGKIVRGIANAIMSPFEGAINGVIKGVNWILGAVGSDTQFDLWEAPHFERGTGGLSRDTIGVVNDQKGATYKEMIIPPNGKPFIPEGRDVVLPLKKGTKIMPANQTKSFLEELPHFANGIGDFFGGVWEGIKDFTGNVWDYITHPKKIVQIAIDKFTDLSNVLEPWLSVTKGVVNTLLDGVVDFITGTFDKQLYVNYNPSAGVEQWRKMAIQALKITGQYSDANLERLLYQMQTESGGNPNAINNWDINAINGTPSKGLMQVIDPTFQAYAMPGYDSNIWDPLSNMLASIRYALARYGSLAAAYQGVGYMDGIGDISISDLIPILDIKWFEKGGILTKPTIFNLPNGGIGGAGEAGAEAILPIDKLKDYVKEAVLEVIGDKNIQTNVSITIPINGKILAEETVDFIQPLLKRNEIFNNLLGGKR